MHPHPGCQLPPHRPLPPLPWLVVTLLSFSVLTTHGLGEPVGVSFDLQGYLDQATQESQTRIVIPPGRYRVTPRNRQHLLLHNLRDIEIIAEDVEMICTETTRAITITHCTNVTLRGLVIDYDPLPFTQGRITGFSADKTLHEIELFEGYPPAATARNFKYEIFRPDTRTLRCDEGTSSASAVAHHPERRMTGNGRRLWTASSPQRTTLVVNARVFFRRRR